MPAINVAKTDTFEIFRQKVNQIGSQIFNISQGGSDLSTGNLKLGDGSVSLPSLAFTTDNSLGIYKPSGGVLGFASNSKGIFNLSQSSVISFQDLVLRQQVLDNAGLSITNNGQNYDVGLYENIELTGGSGSGATANIIVASFGGTVKTIGQNYTGGIHNNINLLGGSGTGAVGFFTVQGLSGQISSAGNGYIPGIYENVTITGGSGTGAVGTVTITGNISYTGTISSGGGNTDGTYTGLQFKNTPTQIYTVTTTSNGTPPPDNLYVINGVTQNSLTLEKGNTYHFDVSDPSMSGHPLAFSTILDTPLNADYYVISSYGLSGNTGSFVELVIKNNAPTENILYYCQNHSGMGGNISVVAGTELYYGSGAAGDVVVSGGSVTSVTVSGGNDYKIGDEIFVPALELGQGSGFTFTINNITYTGTVTNLEITDQGVNYIFGDTIGIDSTDVGGIGSGFSYLVTSNPGILDNISFISRGSGYVIGDVLTLPGAINNVSASLKGFVETSITSSNGSAVVSLNSTAGILSGMTVTASDTVIPPGTTVLSVDSATQLTLSQSATDSQTINASFRSDGNLNIATVSSTAGIFNNYLVEKVSGSGEIAEGTFVDGVNSTNNTITLSQDPIIAGDIVLNFIPSYGVPTVDFEFEIDTAGSIESVTIVEGGNGYVSGDVVSVNSGDLKTPIDYTFSTLSVVDVSFVSTIAAGTFTTGTSILVNGFNLTIREVVESEGNTDYIVVDYEQTFVSGNDITYNSIQYTTNVVSQEKGRFIINGTTTPDLTLYVGNTYRFIEQNPLPDDTNPDFSFSIFPGGEWGKSLVDSVAVTLDVNSNTVTVSDPTNIVPGMTVSFISGDGGLFLDTKVLEVNGNIIILSKPPQNSGSSIIAFRGTEFSQGVTKSVDEVSDAVITTIKISNTTPSVLYYYSKNGADFGGIPNDEAVLTIDSNNPDTLGSGLSVLVVDVTSTDVISGDISSGDFSATKLVSTDLQSTNALIEETLESNTLSTTNLNVDIIRFSDFSSSTPISVFSKIDLLEDVKVGSTILFESSSGNINTNGDISFTGSLTSNQALRITNSTISSLQSNDLILTPSTGRTVKINSTGALIIPSGNNNSRPSGNNLAVNGAIRFNTDSQQYEGYSENTNSWSSLGGIRDLDGNTTILAEETVGSNDNTLWFINDNINTVRFTPQYQEFVNVKKIRSVNTIAPQYIEWAANTPVATGDYLKYRNNIFEVLQGGTTGTSGSEPVDTSGNSFSNGTTTLRFFISAIAPLTFEEISQLNIDPLGFTNLVVNGELRFSKNVISTDVNDLILRPNSGQKISINSNTSLVIPVGDSNSRGNAAQGSIRFNTTISQYEGYDGTNWSSLGGVRDVDGNTYIVPELSAGSNENILYFFNNNTNTLRVTETQLEFDTIDTIVSETSDTLNINASTITFDSLATTIDNTSTTETFLFGTKENFDIGLSAGLVVDPIIRLNDTGEIYYNLGFGTGFYDGVKLLDSDLKEFELSDYKLVTRKVSLERGLINSGSAVIYDPAIHAGAKVEIVAHNTTTGDKEFIEYSIIDKGTDIFHTEFGNIKTGAELISAVFDFNANNNVRVTFTLSSALATGNNIQVTVVSNIIKR